MSVHGGVVGVGFCDDSGGYGSPNLGSLPRGIVCFASLQMDQRYLGSIDGGWEVVEADIA